MWSDHFFLPSGIYILYIWTISTIYYKCIRTIFFFWRYLVDMRYFIIDFRALGHYYRVNFEKKWREYYCCTLWGVAIGLYIQGNIVSTNYGTLDGRIDWELYQGVGIWNTILWIACLALPFLLYKFVPGIWRFICNYISAGILAVQLIILCILFATFNSRSVDIDYQLTNLGRFQLSKNENTLIFVLDAYDSQYFSDFIEQYPEYKERLWSNFTFYPNTVGGGIRTKLAMPQILTNQHYITEEPYQSYLEKAYTPAYLYNALHDEKYNIGI